MKEENLIYFRPRRETVATVWQGQANKSVWKGQKRPNRRSVEAKKLRWLMEAPSDLAIRGLGFENKKSVYADGGFYGKL